MSDLPPKKDALRDEDPVQLDRGSAGPRVYGAEPVDIWQGRVPDGERVLWQGEPDPALAAARPPTALPMLALYGLGAVVGLGLLLRRDGDFPVKALAMALTVFSALLLARGVKAGRREPGAVYYLLSDRAMYMARVRPGAAPTIHRHEYTPQTPVRGGASFVTINIGFRRRTRHNDGEPVVFGFHDIRDAALVHTLIRDIQKGKT